MTDSLLKELEPELTRIRELMMEAIEDANGHDRMKSILKRTAAAPGKMIRPLLMFLVCGDKIYECRDYLLPTAAAVELIHGSSLILDDIIDDSPLRRDIPTIHKQYGVPTAICGGVFQLASALGWLTQMGLTDMSKELLYAIQAACDGEAIQHENRWNTDVDEERYLDAVRGKTAYTFLAACRVAAMISGRNEKESSLLENFGLNLGIMFQLRDDVLDFTTKEQELGKPVNEDFSKGIYTLPTTYAFRSEYGDRLKKLAEKSALNNEDLAEVRQIVKDAGGIVYTEEYIKKLGIHVDELLDKIPRDRYTETMRWLVRKLEG